jgi:hypothetical protein
MKLYANKSKYLAEYVVPCLPSQLRQEDTRFKDSLGYIARLCLERKKERKEGRKDLTGSLII